jgi:hypothetical protein
MLLRGPIYGWRGLVNRVYGFGLNGGGRRLLRRWAWVETPQTGIFFHSEIIIELVTQNFPGIGNPFAGS